jgi:hydrophobic/amphiphilic exporter-1 (mainly G- bacteria), HAE1 family
MQIPGLEMVTSDNGQGHSSFVLQFDLSKSIDWAATDVQAAITRATAQLPHCQAVRQRELVRKSCSSITFYYCVFSLEYPRALCSSI